MTRWEKANSFAWHPSWTLLLHTMSYRAGNTWWFRAARMGSTDSAHPVSKSRFGVIIRLQFYLSSSMSIFFHDMLLAWMSQVGAWMNSRSIIVLPTFREDLLQRWSAILESWWMWLYSWRNGMQTKNRSQSICALNSVDRSGMRGRFLHGVASGDPLPDAIILWTRLTPIEQTSEVP